MYDFERDLIGDIPLAMAAEFFVETKNFGDPGGEMRMYKFASVRMQSKAQEIIGDLLAGRMPEGKAGFFKTAESEGIKWHERYRPMAGYTAGTALGGAGTLALMRGLKGKYKALGLAAGVPLVLGGGTLGALAATESLPKHKLMAMTQGVERELPSHQRQGVLRQRARVMRDLEKKSSIRFRMALWKMAQGLPSGINPEGMMPQASEETMTPSPAPPSPPQETTSPPLEVPTTEPMNYIGAELAGRQLQNVNESGFYRERLEQASAMNQQLQEQVTQLSQMAQEAQTQAAATAGQMQVSQQEAVDANQRALQHSQEAANMRMGMQKLREQMFQIASQEPETVLEQAQSAVAQGQEQAMQQQVPSPGIPGGRVPPSLPGAAVPPGGAGQQVPTSGNAAKEETEAVKAQQEAVKQTGQAEAAKAKDQAKGQTNVQVKTSGAREYVGKELARRAPYMAGGALLGAGESLYKAEQLPALKQKVQELEAASGEGGFSQAARLAKARMQMEMASVYKKYPGRAAAGQAVVTGLAGGLMGPEIVDLARGLRQSIGKARAI